MTNLLFSSHKTITQILHYYRTRLTECSPKIVFNAEHLFFARPVNYLIALFKISQDSMTLYEIINNAIYKNLNQRINIYLLFYIYVYNYIIINFQVL